MSSFPFARVRCVQCLILFLTALLAGCGLSCLVGLVLSQTHSIFILAWKLVIIEVWSEVCQRHTKVLSSSALLEYRSVLVDLGVLHLLTTGFAPRRA